MVIEYSTAGRRGFLSKPTDFPTTTRYFYNLDGTRKNVEPVKYHIDYFADQIAKGFPFYPCVLSDKGGTFKSVVQECFEYADIIGFDLEKGEHSEQRVKTELIDKGLKPCIFYRTYSHRQNGNGDRNRIIFKLPYRIESKAEYLLLCVLFRALYWDIDTACIDTARIFFGTNSIEKVRKDAAAVLDLSRFVSLSLRRLEEYRDSDTARYNDILTRLAHPSINCRIDDNGLPVAFVGDDGRFSFEEDTAKRKRNLTVKAPVLTDEMLSNESTEIKKIPMPYWREKALIEPLYRELVNGRGHYGYKKAMVLVSSYRFIEAEDVKKDIFDLLIRNGDRFSNIQHTIEEADKIWNLPAVKGSGYGCKPLKYAECDMLPQDTYEYPLTFLRNIRRTLDLKRDARIRDDLGELLKQHDFEKYPKSIILNGGMGLGKTYACLHDLKPALDAKYNKQHKIVFLTSRKASTIQILLNYPTYTVDSEKIWKNPDGIAVMSYHKFMGWIQQGQIKQDEFDIIIADEAQSTAHDTFASQMGAFLTWANENYNGIVIWISANGRYLRDIFNRLSDQLGKAYDNHYKMLYETEGGQLRMRFDTSHIDFYTHSNIDYAIIPTLSKACREHRILVFISSASKCFDYYYKAKKKGYRVAFWVSEYCDTPLNEKYLSDYGFELLDDAGRVSLTLHDAFMLMEDERSRANIETLRKALLSGEHYPEDIDIIFTTSALRESININEQSNVLTVITDAYDEVEVLQQRGRIRGDVETLVICPQRQGAEQRIRKQISVFESLMSFSQFQLAEEYGRTAHKKARTAFIIKHMRLDGEIEYRINYPAYFALKAKLDAFEAIKKTNDKTQLYLDDVFGCLSSGNRVNIAYEKPSRRRFVDASLREILPKYKGLPLIGDVERALIEECRECLRDFDGDTKFSLKLILKEARDAGYTVKEGQIGKKHQKMGYTEPLKTKFRYIL